MSNSFTKTNKYQLNDIQNTHRMINNVFLKFRKILNRQKKIIEKNNYMKDLY